MDDLFFMAMAFDEEDKRAIVNQMRGKPFNEYNLREACIRCGVSYERLSRSDIRDIERRLN